MHEMRTYEKTVLPEKSVSFHVRGISLQDIQLAVRGKWSVVQGFVMRENLLSEVLDTGD